MENGLNPPQIIWTQPQGRGVGKAGISWSFLSPAPFSPPPTSCSAIKTTWTSISIFHKNKSILVDVEKRHLSSMAQRFRKKALKLSAFFFSFDSSFFFFFFFFFHFSHPEAYGAPEPGIRSKLQLRPERQLQQCLILNPLCQAGDQTYISAFPRCC